MTFLAARVDGSQPPFTATPETATIAASLEAAGRLPPRDGVWVFRSSLKMVQLVGGKRTSRPDPGRFCRRNGRNPSAVECAELSCRDSRGTRHSGRACGQGFEWPS